MKKYFCLLVKIFTRFQEFYGKMGQNASSKKTYTMLFLMNQLVKMYIARLFFMNQHTKIDIARLFLMNQLFQDFLISQKSHFSSFSTSHKKYILYFSLIVEIHPNIT
ncbi:hypothetical protein D1R32_gp463 [Tunisvirus fontaine2]|uniref:Uncharacterized protein n=1 Tax=Tunisvirus fontaine2 TaxID=1421067 RepID=V9SEM8_9VIRU|nr:hypothetical protein D1R32_gp463 [Tunisvirus fontaine2]AHC55180.1 hypothetical protein TNS_ORF462 [Tunisvirus fontaine2]